MTNGNSAERELFEEYMKKEHPMMPLDRHTDKDSIKFDEYRVNWIEDMWESWQARAALSVCAEKDAPMTDEVAWKIWQTCCDGKNIIHDMGNFARAILAANKEA